MISTCRRKYMCSARPSAPRNLLVVVQVYSNGMSFYYLFYSEEAKNYGIIDEVIQTKTSHIERPAMPML